MTVSFFLAFCCIPIGSRGLSQVSPYFDNEVYCTSDFNHCFSDLARPCLYWLCAVDDLVLCIIDFGRLE